MAMVLNDAVKLIKDISHRGNPDVTTDAITAKILRAITEARREVVRRLPKEWLKKTGTVSLADGTREYSFPSDLQEPDVLWYTDSSDNSDHVLRKIPGEREYYQQYYDSNGTEDAPAYYVEIAPSSKVKKFYVYPVPEKSYTLNVVYYKDPSGTVLTTSDLASAIPDIPDYCFDAVWKKALYLFLRSFDDANYQQALADADRAFVEADIADDRDEDDDIRFRFGRNSRTLRSDISGLSME